MIGSMNDYMIYAIGAPRQALSSKEYAATTRKKREDTAQGKQFSKQPQQIANKTKRYRK